MVQLSILIPLRDAGEATYRLAVGLDAMLRRTGQSYELLLIDDASQLETARTLEQLRQQHASVNWLRLDRPSGLSAALTAGIAAARGEIVVAIEASEQYTIQQIPQLIERLSRADLVCGRRQRSRLGKLTLALAQVPRRWLLGLEIRDPDCLFWAARREALCGLELAAGMHRFLGSLITTRGFRAAEIHVNHRPAGPPPAFAQARPSLGNLLCAWWHRQSWQPYSVSEVGISAVPGQPVARPLQVSGNIDRAAA